MQYGKPDGAGQTATRTTLLYQTESYYPLRSHPNAIHNIACEITGENDIIRMNSMKGVVLVKDRKDSDTISRADVQHVASLARLALSDEEEERFQHQLRAVFEHFAKLSDLDTEQISPTAQVIPLKNVMRPDTVASSLTDEEVLANAPDREDDQFRVRAILDF